MWVGLPYSVWSSVLPASFGRMGVDLVGGTEKGDGAGNAIAGDFAKEGKVLNRL